MQYIQGEARSQGSLFPQSLDELVPEDHLVRVIEAYVARLDLRVLGFSKAQARQTGRPSYDPADLLKLYLYGYFQRIRSSRRLEAECQRNVEVMWLLGRLAPDFKTIADFRKDNGAAFAATCRAFVQFCRQVGLIAGQLVAIDGSKFQAVASARKQLSLKQLKRQQERLEKHITDYLAQLEAADRAEADEAIDRSAVKAALQRLQGKHADNLTSQALLEAQQLEQFVVGEADAKVIRGVVVVPMDADLQHPPETIVEMVQRWREGFDVVLAKRENRKSETWLRRKTAGWFYAMQNKISEVEIPADVGDFRLMDRKVVAALRQLPERRRFMKGLFAWVGFPHTTITFTCEARLAGNSKFSGWRLWNFALEGVTSFSTAPLRVWTYLGSGIAALAFICAIFLIAKTLMFGRDVPGYASLITSSLFLGGLQLVGLGVLGEYIGRIYGEVKQRPIYVIRDFYDFPEQP